jgi:anaerobic magnesium-protoporphyrin IX monomethyl ester cyclase
VNVLLFSMPDSFEHMPSVAIRMPNGALTSLAGNVDSHHRVAVADLVLVQRRVRETVLRLIEEWARRGRSFRDDVPTPCSAPAR